MNCLKCPNYWNTNIDEVKCDQCGADKTIADVSPVMPPLIMKEEVKHNG
jgi:hypothetical protein